MKMNKLHIKFEKKKNIFQSNIFRWTILMLVNNVDNKFK